MHTDSGIYKPYGNVCYGDAIDSVGHSCGVFSKLVGNRCCHVPWEQFILQFEAHASLSVFLLIRFYMPQCFAHFIWEGKKETEARTACLTQLYHVEPISFSFTECCAIRHIIRTEHNVIHWLKRCTIKSMSVTHFDTVQYRFPYRRIHCAAGSIFNNERMTSERERELQIVAFAYRIFIETNLVLWICRFVYMYTKFCAKFYAVIYFRFMFSLLLVYGCDQRIFFRFARKQWQRGMRKWQIEQHEWWCFQ